MAALFPLPEPQNPIASQRARGAGRLSVKLSAGESRIDRLFQEGSARIRLPKTQKGAPLEAVMINTSGGLTGGDQMDWHFEAGPGAALSVTTQACEKTYKANHGTQARISVALKLQEGSSLAWLPQETILFDKASLARMININMAPDARLLMVEPVAFGRLAMNEAVTSGLFHDRWRLQMDGQLLHAEDMRIGPDIAKQLSRTAIAGGAMAMATILLIAPEAETRLDEARKILGPHGSASFLSRRGAKSGKLLARLVAKDSYELRKVLLPLIGLLNPAAGPMSGTAGGVPKVWSL